MDGQQRLDKIIKRIENEFWKASNKFEEFHNAHEGYAVLLEEVDELWDNIKINQSVPKRDRLIRDEAVQVAAMAIRIIFDCCRLVSDPKTEKEGEDE